MNAIALVNIGWQPRLLICWKSFRKLLILILENRIFINLNLFLIHSLSIEPNPEFWEGKRGACIGALYSVITERSMGKPPNGTMDICNLLRESINPQSLMIAEIIRHLN